MTDNLQIPKNYQTCPFLDVGTCGNCIEMQEQPPTEVKEENKHMIPKHMIMKWVIKEIVKWWKINLLNYQLTENSIRYLNNAITPEEYMLVDSKLKDELKKIKKEIWVNNS